MYIYATKQGGSNQEAQDSGNYSSDSIEFISRLGSYHGAASGVVSLASKKDPVKGAKVREIAKQRLITEGIKEQDNKHVHGIDMEPF